ncbi:MAG: aminotransferase class V-fold PLP-dependent enzyme [Azospirillum sp.]|nr:aminotransferase class V-fold PLP-dependent enzyme [Azospirillum sp.]
MISVYLDYNASAPLRTAVRDAMVEALGSTGNPSSVHRFGRNCRAMVERARRQVASLAGVQPAEVVFTGGGTEANNLALAGWSGARVLVSAAEHDSVLAAAPEAERIAVDGDGVIDLAALDAGLAAPAGGRPTLVSVMLANNETGVIQPIAEVARIAHRRGALVHCDAVQAAGRLAIARDALGVDLLSLSAHKLGGPQGVGALIVADGIAPAALLKGGGQERRRRAGTENVAGIVGFGAAADLAARELCDMARLAALRDDLEQSLTRLAPDLAVLGAKAPRLANTSCLALAGLAGETQVMALDLAGVAIGAGAACSSGKVQPSHVLAAMGIDPRTAAGAIRISLGWASSQDDIDRCIEAWQTLYRRFRVRAAAA